MKDFIKYSSMGITIIGVFLIAYFVGKKIDNLVLTLIVATLFDVLFIIQIIRKEIK